VIPRPSEAFLALDARSERAGNLFGLCFLRNTDASEISSLDERTVGFIDARITATVLGGHSRTLAHPTTRGRVISGVDRPVRLS
jgi:hypothetical protein